MELRLETGGFSPEKRALLDRLLREKGIQRGSDGAIPRRRSSEPAPLTHLQEGLWFLDRFDPGQATYNIPCATRLAGPLDARALERALAEIASRHEALRTVYPERGGRPVQVVLPAGSWSLAIRDLSGLGAAEREREVLRLATAEAARPFDLERGPLFRAELLRLSEREHVLLFCIHHIAADGWSFRVFTRELAELYAAFRAGRPSPLAPLPLQFGDYAAWQRALLEGPELERLLGFWRSYLAGVAALELPADRPRPARPGARGRHHSFALPAELSERVRALGRAEGCTPFVTLLAVFKALLHAHSGQTDVVIGSPVACRSRSELEELIGYFVNVLPFRTDLGGDPTLRELIRRVDASVAQVHAHQELPFAKLVEELRPARQPGANPIYQVEFTLLSYEHAPAVYNYGFRSAVKVAHELAGGLELSPLEVESGVAKFDLVVLLWDVPAGISGTFEYDADRFDEATVVELARRYQRLLEIYVQRPELSLSGARAGLGLPAGSRAEPAARPARSAVAPAQARRRRVAGEGPSEEAHGG
jgi:hypothetical protein